MNWFNIIGGVFVGIVGILMAVKMWNIPGYETMAIVPGIFGFLLVSFTITYEVWEGVDSSKH